MRTPRQRKRHRWERLVRQKERLRKFNEFLKKRYRPLMAESNVSPLRQMIQRAMRERNGRL